MCSPIFACCSLTLSKGSQTQECSSKPTKSALLKSFSVDIEKSYSSHRISRSRCETGSSANRKTARGFQQSHEVLTILAFEGVDAQLVGLLRGVVSLWCSRVESKSGLDTFLTEDAKNHLRIKKDTRSAVKSGEAHESSDCLSDSLRISWVQRISPCRSESTTRS